MSRRRSSRSRSKDREKRRRSRSHERNGSSDRWRKSRSRSRSRDRGRKRRDRNGSGSWKRRNRRSHSPKKNRHKKESEKKKEEEEAPLPTKPGYYYDEDLMMFKKLKPGAQEAAKKRKKTRNLHWSKKELTDMNERDWRIFKEDFRITNKGAECPRPLRSWEEAHLPEQVTKNIAKAKYVEPTAIQRASLPPGLIQKDVVGIAETGSGKTAAFLIPMLVYLMKLPRLTKETALDGPYSLIMAPSRDLAQQIHEETKKLGRDTGIRAVDIVGGLSIEKQGFNVCEGAEVVIGTPGRLLDCIKRRYLALNQCYYVVLDEADVMVDMGFDPQIRAVMDQMPATHLKPDEDDAPLIEGKNYRQTTMFSATMKSTVEAVMKSYMRNPVFLLIGETGAERINRNIDQRVYWLASASMKDAKLVETLKKETERGNVDRGRCIKTIIFCNEKATCKKVERVVSDAGHKAILMYSKLMQDKRMANLADFKANKADICVGTDVVGRGIDVSDVMLVINYDVPNAAFSKDNPNGNIEKYTHRIGRTGRAGKKGIAISLMTDADVNIMYNIKLFLQKSGGIVPTELRSHPMSSVKPGGIGISGKSMARKGKILYLRE